MHLALTRALHSPHPLTSRSFASLVHIASLVIFSDWEHSIPVGLENLFGSVDVYFNEEAPLVKVDCLIALLCSSVLPCLPNLNLTRNRVETQASLL